MIPAAYTFDMTRSHRRWVPAPCPSDGLAEGCSRAEVDDDVCTFVRAIGDGLRAHGVPVRDLIDAESFIWVRYRLAPQRRLCVAASCAKSYAPARARAPNPRRCANGPCYGASCNDDMGLLDAGGATLDGEIITNEAVHC
jgi:hypothetical protein